MIFPLATVFEITPETIKENLPQILLILIGTASVLILVNEYLKSKSRAKAEQEEEIRRRETISSNKKEKEISVEWGVALKGKRSHPTQEE